jgi:hypothetical protein
LPNAPAGKTSPEVYGLRTGVVKSELGIQRYTLSSAGKLFPTPGFKNINPGCVLLS